MSYNVKVSSRIIKSFAPPFTSPKKKLEKKGVIEDFFVLEEGEFGFVRLIVV